MAANMFYALDIIGQADDKIPQCEYCDIFVVGPDALSEMVIDPDDPRRYCSDGCYLDAAEQRRVGMIEAGREFEIWGNDYDSWYR